MARSHKQAAVIPYRITRWRVEIALVRTSSGKGWTVPKGSLDKGESGREADRGRRWMAVEEAMKRLPPELHPCVRETQRIARYRPGPQLGPGTARETVGGPRSLAGTPAAAARRPAVASA